MRQTRIYLLSLLLVFACLFLLAPFISCFDYFDWSDEASPALSEDEDDDADDDDASDDDASDDDAPDDDATTGDVWEDSNSGLMWQNASDCCYDWSEAKSHCQNLNWGWYEDWRLPSISELRSLIRGCSATETGGSCGVTDSCLEYSCQDSSCHECSSGGGPADGCYWPSQLNGDCSHYWSSSAVADYDSPAWYVYFDYGYVDYYRGSYVVGANGFGGVRCVR